MVCALRSFVWLLLLVGWSLSAEAAWTLCGPQEAFQLSHITVDPSEPNTIYATGITSAEANSEAAWKTTDGGQSWSQMALDYKAAGLLLIDPGDPKILYASSSCTVSRSADGGKTWTGLGGVADAAPHLRTFALALALAPNGPGTLYLGLGFQGYRADGGIWESQDGGAHWTASGLRGSTVYDVDIVQRDRKTLYVATSQGLFRNTDGGDNWDDIGPPGVEARHMTVDVDADDPKRILVGTSGDGVFRTVDGGQSWVPSVRGLTHPAVYALAIDPRKPQNVWAGTSGGGVFRSTDGGMSWRHVDEGAAVTYASTVIIVPGEPSVVYVIAGRDGLLRWTEPDANPEAER